MARYELGLEGDSRSLALGGRKRIHSDVLSLPVSTWALRSDHKIIFLYAQNAYRRKAAW